MWECGGRGGGENELDLNYKIRYYKDWLRKRVNLAVKKG